ncbi:MAG: hypothetical protein COU35_02315 [Candidatus Magasanikbacteria bacterium CG10_big_fil_rev_8_21_14_0_10_47_10]|uniref:Nudix hydrolase domain-containing protein n=1 Tax=Candidatus Magasanikbacteria bacterium CG10_big_fil_rev_8_21_14_0_10_47_10 TaxID=1974652 RepID=A0A2H0TQP4_9BACT|nr:MAG: hypothetical protein COU35_02315 [Candidatus Magasanikbacteria bacterium CG10_big_fil_rev_8_21_14_0_10_47_10]
MKLLLGTNNPGKQGEILQFLEHLDIEPILLSNLAQAIEEPDEPYDSLEQNSFFKAKYYADKTGLITLADDTGLFIDALDGWPGVKSARTGKTTEDRIALVLQKMKTVPKGQRSAAFKNVVTVYDPTQTSWHAVTGELQGEISESQIGTEGHWGYNSIFYIPQLAKTYEELTIKEKNEISHRGIALTKLKYYFQKNYSPRQILVACGIIVDEGKILMAKRNDPHRPAFHGKWEFPGGVVEYGEMPAETVLREVKEETGYDVRAVSQIAHTHSVTRETEQSQYQVNLIPFLCSVTGGAPDVSDREILELAWFAPEDIPALDLLDDNVRMYRAIEADIKKYIV